MLGLGIDNLAALAAVSGAGPASLTAAVDDVDAVTDADCLVLVAAGAELVTTALAIDVVEAAGGGSGLRGGSGSSEGSVVVLRAPGYPRHGPVCARLERSGARFTTAVDLWMGTYGSDREVVGITGTKGKSTVTSLLDQLLDLLGIEHLMGGNIGLAIWEQAPLPPSGVPAVIEVSSYMAADAHHPPSIGVLTSLDADHLTWHGSVEAYRTDKVTGLTATPEKDGYLLPSYAYTGMVTAKPVTASADQPTSSGGIPPWVWIAVLAVVAAGVGVALRRRGSGDDEAETD